MLKDVLKIAPAVAFTLVLSSCGSGSKDEKGSLGDKKAQLEKLKADKEKLDGQIKSFE